MSFQLLVERITLVVDLDGTFLNSPTDFGDPLYRFIDAHKDQITLIFCTGRGLESIMPVVSNPRIPNPNYIIGDVGSSVVHGATFEPVFEIQSSIDQKWPGAHRIQSLMSQFPMLHLQPVPQERRCSYFVDDQSLDLSPLAKLVSPLGCEVLLSAGKYLDILPKGISKGSTVLQLLESKGLDPSTTLVAGDTMNDLSMFKTGLPAVAVGESEPLLLKETSQKGRNAKTCTKQGKPFPGLGNVIYLIGNKNSEDGKSQDR